jgi:RNA polymerase sigma-70 factor, ECF subfamily
MRDMTLTDLERAAAAVGEDEAAVFVMEEEAFRVFYERTARAVWSYLSRMTGDRQLADDLLQETYYRFLRARADYESEAHRQNALYRIATNLVRDGYRRDRRRPASVPLRDEDDRADTHSGADAAERAETRTDVSRALAQLRPRDRQLLWLAYAQEMTHKEIAEGLGLKTASIKLLLWRARRRLMGLLRGSEGGRA